MHFDFFMAVGGDAPTAPAVQPKSKRVALSPSAAMLQNECVHIMYFRDTMPRRASFRDPVFPNAEALAINRTFALKDLKTV